MNCVGDDARALIWDLQQSKKVPQEPSLCYNASAPIDYVSWSRVHQDWIAINAGQTVEMLRV
jgi:hypothetical protein